MRITLSAKWAHLSFEGAPTSVSLLASLGAFFSASSQLLGVTRPKLSLRCWPAGRPAPKVNLRVWLAGAKGKRRNKN